MQAITIKQKFTWQTDVLMSVDNDDVVRETDTSEENWNNHQTTAMRSQKAK